MVLSVLLENEIRRVAMVETDKKCFVIISFQINPAPQILLLQKNRVYTLAGLFELRPSNCFVYNEEVELYYSDLLVVVFGVFILNSGLQLQAHIKGSGPYGGLIQPEILRSLGIHVPACARS